MSLIRNLPAAITDVRVGGWRRDLFIGHDLKGRKLGILGLGRIGKMVARYGQVFGMQVKFFDSDKTLFCEALERTNSIEELFSWSDILTVHVPLTAETQGLISKNLINKMQKTSYLINTSRGRIINETDLTAALNSKTISGAALDVLTGEHESEFPKASEIWKYAKTNNNLIITPHIGGATYDSWEKTEFFICDKLSEYLESLVE
ncbi:MAG: hypothetical protein FJZ67_11205 [Bacteroidetes bacterium]|nr:hypothetical protein [Bacteroidota bacterium]